MSEKVADYLYNTVEVAQRLNTTPSQLCRWRKTGSGPEELREGAGLVWLTPSMPRYRPEYVEALIRGESR